MCYDGALVLPSSYAVMDEGEMVYTEGGYYLKKTWYGYTGYFTAKECSDISNALWMGTGVAGIGGAVAGFLSCGVGALVGGVLAGTGAIYAGYFGIGANHRGVNFKIIGWAAQIGAVRW